MFNIRGALACGLAVVAVVGAGSANAKIIDGDAIYTPPTASLQVENTREVQSSFDATWRAVVAHLAETAFVIDNIDKDSGLIAVSFSVSDPRTAIDCGHWTTWVKNLRGRRDYAFDAAQPNAAYEVLVNGKTLTNLERRLSLGGKFNILVLPVDDATTKIKVTARYVPAMSLTVSPLIIDPTTFQRVPSRTINDTASFTTGDEGHFTEGASTCRATGELERGLLNGFAPAPSP